MTETPTYFFHPEPDFRRPLLELTPAQRRSILEKLTVLYGGRRAEICFVELDRLMKVFYAHKTPAGIAADARFDARHRFTEEDVVLITYGDLLVGPLGRPLSVLGDFLRRSMRGSINTVHILPFFPYSSDRGFAIIDYEDVDPHLGTWADVEALAADFRLMFDGVFNHVSSKSRWFQRFLNGRPGFQDFFVSFPTRDAIDQDRLRLILRPRTSDLLTRFDTIDGPRWVWTTFGPDQVDLNFKNETVLIRVVEIMLMYVRRGAELLRLDAVTYIWREIGTRCAHLREAHTLVQLFRAILDAVAPRVALITETNVPHEDNISYFGDGEHEAQMVYNFALPPLVLHTFHAGDATALSTWVGGLAPTSDTATFLNFLDSHDGIGLMGAQGILTPAQIGELVDRTRAHGGLVSYRDAGDGQPTPYELNITWYSALNRDDAGEAVSLQVSRFIASRAIALALAGVPAIYLPSVFGAKNDTAAMAAGAEPRSINRRALDTEVLFALLEDRATWVHQVAHRLRRLLERRRRIPAFHPNAAQRILPCGPEIFGLVRIAPDALGRVVTLVNVTSTRRRVVLDASDLGTTDTTWRDALTRRTFSAADGSMTVTLEPYDVVWLVPARRR